MLKVSLNSDQAISHILFDSSIEFCFRFFPDYQTSVMTFYCILFYSV